MRKTLFASTYAFIFAIILTGIFTQKIYAEDTGTMSATGQLLISDAGIYWADDVIEGWHLDENGQTVNAYNCGVYCSRTLTVDYDTNADFSTAKEFTVSADNWCWDKFTTIALPTADFEVSGTYYFKAKGTIYNRNTCVTYVTDWTAPVEYIMVEISKENFGGLCEYIKSGGYTDDTTGKFYKAFEDLDGWLTQGELDKCVSLYIDDYTVKNVKGLKYFKNLERICFKKFTGGTIDLSTNKKMISLIISQKMKGKLTIKAPYLKRLQLGDGWDGNKVKKVDISKCTGLIILDINTIGNPKVVMPKKNSKLRYIYLAQISNKSIDLNRYKNLQICYLCFMENLSKIKVNKCKKLEFMALSIDPKIGAIDMSGCKKLVHMEGYSCSKYTVAGVKAPKSAKVTKGWGAGNFEIYYKRYRKL